MATSKKPSVLTDCIPAELRSLKQWVLWRYETHDEKLTKIPYQVNGSKAESDNPATWAAFDKALAVLPKYDGLGIMFANGLAGIDLDHHIDGGALSEYARSIVDKLNSYTEYSPSGTGLHILLWSGLPEGGRKNTQNGIEMYSEGRYFTVTGRTLEGTPATVNHRAAEVAELHRATFPKQEPKAAPAPTQPNNLDDQALLDKALNAKNGARFGSLYAGNWQAAGFTSQSEADLSLCGMLAFWTGNDTGRIDRLFRSSGLMRDKWDKSHDSAGNTYGQMTIEIGQVSTVYEPHQGPQEAPSRVEPEEPEFYPMDLTELDRLAPAAAPAIVWNLGRFKLHTAAEALAPQPPTDWIVKGMFSAGGVYALCGDSGSKKTFVMTDCCVCVAGGKDWLDFPTTPGPVLIVDEESGEVRLNRRLGAAMRAHSCGAELPLYYVTLARVDIRNPEDINMLQALIKQTGARLVVIDSMIDVIPGADENSSKDLQPGLMALSKLAKVEGCAVIVIHHTNKAGGYRGTSAIKAAIDGLYMLESKNGSPVVEVTTEKTRDTGPVNFTAIVHFRSDPATGELETVYFSAADPQPKEPKFSKSEQYVMGYLRSNGDAEITTITEAADSCSPASARQAVYSLTSKGIVERKDTGKQGMKAVYGLKPGSQPWEVVNLERSKDV